MNCEIRKLRGVTRDIKDRTLQFAVRIVRLCQMLEKSPGAARILASQIVRAGTSVGANVHESRGSQSRADFISKCSIACKEAHETLYWLQLLVAADVMNEERLSDLIGECNEIVAILTTIVKRSKESRS